MAIYSASGTRNMLFVVMEQGKSAEKERQFVQDMMCAPESMAGQCSNLDKLLQFLFSVLQSLWLFCVPTSNFWILGDSAAIPSFSLCLVWIQLSILVTSVLHHWYRDISW